MAKVKKIKVKLACTYGEKKPGEIVSLDESLAHNLIRQHMATLHIEESSTGTAQNEDLKQALAEKCAEVDALTASLEEGGKGFNDLVESILSLDPEAEDVAAKLAEFQKSLGAPVAAKEPSKKNKQTTTLLKCVVRCPRQSRTTRPG